MRRLLESLSGMGTIHVGELLLRTTRYELSLWSDDQPGEDAGALAGIDGHIDIAGIGEAIVLAGPGSLTLTVEDGRRIAFHLTSSSGGIEARGWLP